MEWQPVIFASVVLLLGHSHYIVREAAFDYLSKHPAIAALKQGEKSKDAEIRLRCELLVNRWYYDHAEQETDQYKPQKLTVWPWIDSLVVGQETAQYYLTEARKGLPTCGSPYWEDYSLATRLLVRDLVAARRPVTDLVEQLRVSHLDWCRLNDHKWPPRKRP